MGFVDLHVHSTASDGSCPPEAVISLAVQAGLDAIALTDHDTVDGIPAAQNAADAAGIRLIPGIEVSSIYHGTEIHILGLFVTPSDPVLGRMLEEFRRIRDDRNRQMLSRLEQDGMPLTRAQLTGSNPDTVITRAHVARAMVEAGYAPSLDQAYKRYLSRPRGGGLRTAVRRRLRLPGPSLSVQSGGRRYPHPGNADEGDGHAGPGGVPLLPQPAR